MTCVAVLAACGDGSGDGQAGPAAQSVESASADQVAVIGKAPANSGPPIYRFAKISNGSYFYTGSEAEKQSIITTMPDFRYEGSVFGASSGTGATQVYRFANLQSGGYFYSANSGERDIVNRDYTTLYRDEGSSFSVDSGPSTSNLLIYRVANTVNGSYLYTPDQAEVDAAVTTGRWRSEGVAFSARPTGLEECWPRSASGFTYEMQCRGVSRVPWIVGTFTGVVSDSSGRATGGTCSVQSNEIGDIVLILNGTAYTSRFDGSTRDDFLMRGAGIEGVSAHNPLNGSFIVLGRQTATRTPPVIAQYYADRAAAESGKATSNCNITATQATKDVETQHGGISAETLTDPISSLVAGAVDAR